MFTLKFADGSMDIMLGMKSNARRELQRYIPTLLCINTARLHYGQHQGTHPYINVLHCARMEWWAGALHRVLLLQAGIVLPFCIPVLFEL